jgi:hypothetical protein
LLWGLAPVWAGQGAITPIGPTHIQVCEYKNMLLRSQFNERGDFAALRAETNGMICNAKTLLIG